MVEYRRSRFVLFSIAQSQVFDAQAFLRGALATRTEVTFRAFSAVTGESVELDNDGLEFFASISATEWHELESSESEFTTVFAQLLDAGLLLEREPTTPIRVSILDLEEKAHATWWDPVAFCFFKYTIAKRARGLPPRPYKETLLNADRFADEYIAKYGDPPPAFFHGKDRLESIALPTDSGWKKTRIGQLLRRRTTNRFLSTDAIRLETLATMLEASFRHHSVVQIGQDFLTLRKSSPSGGSLHPIEAYVSVRSVEGLASGYYHYEVESHRLGLLQKRSATDVSDMNRRFAAQQDFAGDAAALVILVARFDGHQWKYRFEPNVLSVLFTDAGHLSQTLYLIGTELGLATFYTGALDYKLISSEMGLDSVSIGPLGIFGFGFPSTQYLEKQGQPAD